jgi:DNA invertase Pin-like site-specific DNA recombinase
MELQYNYYALCLAVIKRNYTVDSAIDYFSPRLPGQKDVESDEVVDMVEMKKDMTYKEIGQIYGLKKDTVYRRIKRFKKGSVEN